MKQVINAFREIIANNRICRSGSLPHCAATLDGTDALRDEDDIA